MAHLVYSVYFVCSVYLVYSVCSVCSVYLVYSVCSVCSVYLVYSVCFVYLVRLVSTRSGRARLCFPAERASPRSESWKAAGRQAAPRNAVTLRSLARCLKGSRVGGMAIAFIRGRQPDILVHP